MTAHTVLGVKFSLREIGRISPTEIRNLKLWKMPKFLILGFQKGDIFLIVTMLNSKDPIKYFFLFPNERHRWAVVGY